MVENIRIPPDSTGKKIAVEQRRVVDFDQQTIAFNIGDIVTGSISGATGEITAIIIEGYPANEGRLYLKDVSVATFVNNEDLQVSGVTRAVVNTTNVAVSDLNTQHMIVVDPNNPERQQKLDRFGATLNTFTDGSPLFSPFGAMLVGQNQRVKDYRFAYDELPNEFWDQEISGATVSYESTSSCVLLSNPVTSGAVASRTSHFYHPYVPGIGSLVEISMVVGDTGKANVVREWGLFDDDNGVFWRLNETSLEFVIRSNVSGSPLETVIPQSSFNFNRLDGSDANGFEVDLSKANIYWIDFQWLGAGRVKFGVIDEEGSRITAHIVQNPNNLPGPYMRTGSLPIRMAQENIGLSGSTSEMRIICATVKHTSLTSFSGNRHSTNSGLASFADTDGEVPILSLRPKTTYNGLANRGFVRFKATMLMNNSTSVGPVLWKVYSTNSTALTGASFASHAVDSIVEEDTSATSLAGGHVVLSYITDKGTSHFVQADQDPSSLDVILYLFADGTTQPAFVITATGLASGSSSALATVNWEEILL